MYKITSLGSSPSSTLLANWFISYLNTTYDTGLSAKKKIKVLYSLIKQAGMSNFFHLKKCYSFVKKVQGPNMANDCFWP